MVVTILSKPISLAVPCTIKRHLTPDRELHGRLIAPVSRLTGPQRRNSRFQKDRFQVSKRDYLKLNDDGSTCRGNGQELRPCPAIGH